MLGPKFDRVLRSARDGHAWAWEQLYRDLSPSVLGYFKSRGATDADDLTGSVFVGVVKDLDRFEGDERALRTWVFTIAHRRLVDSFRRVAHSPRESFVAEIREDFGPRGDVEAEALERLGTRRVRALIASLSPDQQDVLLLRILGDQTVVEVAQILDKRIGAVKALQRRGLAALQRRLSEQGRTHLSVSSDYLSDETTNGP